MKISKIILLVFAVSVLSSLLCSCAKKEDKTKEESNTKTESDIQSSTDDGQIIKSGETTSDASTPDIAAKDEKETETSGNEQLQKQVEEVRRTFISLQDACKANDIDGYLDFWDEETKMEVEKMLVDLDVDARRERRRESLKKKPGILNEIANLKIESITVDTTQAERLEMGAGFEIKGTMMLVHTNGRALLFHETAKGWKLFTIGSPEYFR